MTDLIPLEPGTVYESERFRVDKGTGCTIVDKGDGRERWIQDGIQEEGFLNAMGEASKLAPAKAIEVADRFLAHFFAETVPPDYDDWLARQL